MTEPYYQDELVTLYHARCEDVLPTLDMFDLLLTDPPYGIADVWKGGFGKGWSNTAKADAVERNSWDDAAPSMDTLNLAIDKCEQAVIWGGNYFPLPPSRGWLVWNKPERNFSLAEAELAWTNRDNVIRVGDFNRSDPNRWHPTQKPVRLMHWCLEQFPKARSVLDPFAGSGTTLRAAVDRGLRVVGIEANEGYCERIVSRLSQQAFDFADLA